MRYAILADIHANLTAFEVVATLELAMLFMMAMLKLSIIIVLAVILLLLRRR
jgi:hypothetical protein